MADALKHNDCRNFIPVDVAKGICSLANEMIIIDSGACPKFEQLAKCKNCRGFVNPDKDNIGTCVGLNDGGFWALGETIAVTCEGYQVK